MLSLFLKLRTLFIILTNESKLKDGCIKINEQVKIILNKHKFASESRYLLKSKLSWTNFDKVFIRHNIHRISILSFFRCY